MNNSILDLMKQQAYIKSREYINSVISSPENLLINTSLSEQERSMYNAISSLISKNSATNINKK